MLIYRYLEKKIGVINIDDDGHQAFIKGERQRENMSLNPAKERISRPD